MPIRFIYSHRSGSGEAPGAAAGWADARAVEAAGFDSIVLDGPGDDAEILGQAAAALDATERLGVVMPCRPGAAAPTASVRRFAALAGRGNGRLSLFAEPERPRNGLPSHQAALARLDEYLVLFDRLWLNNRPIDHEGKHFRLQRAFIDNRPDGARPQVRMDGASGTALQVAGRHADIFHLASGRLDEAMAVVGRVREAASARGRGDKLGFAAPFDGARLGGAAGSRLLSLSLASEIQRLIAVLACYRDLGVCEFIVTGLRGNAALEAFGAKALPALKASLGGAGWHAPAPRDGLRVLIS